jgi:hypothetical protein
MKRICERRRHADGTVVEVVEEDGKFSAHIVSEDSDLMITRSLSGLVNLEEVKDYADERIRNEYHDCGSLGCPGWVRC